MLKPGWMNRYLPPIAVHLVPDLAWTFGFVWAGLMFLSAALNIALALTLDPVSWSATMSIWGLASKVALFLAQYGLMRFVGMRERFQARDPRSLMLRFHAQTAGSMSTKRSNR